MIMLLDSVLPLQINQRRVILQLNILRMKWYVLENGGNRVLKVTLLWYRDRKTWLLLISSGDYCFNVQHKFFCSKVSWEKSFVKIWVVASIKKYYLLVWQCAARLSYSIVTSHCSDQWSALLWYCSNCFYKLPQIICKVKL